jgi:ribonucleoside-diphosphate reductase alpha chain
MGRIEDDLASIFENVKEAALTMQQGGGIGHDFSTLRPKGALVKSIGADASGPVSFMDVWDSMCRTIMSAGARRGAMMATLRCDHPDIVAFIDAKADPARLRNFNLSVLVTDAFIRAVRNDEPWDLAFEGKTYRTLPARELWDRMMRATYDYAEPGVVFIDRVNAENNLAYCETISATNPCGEQPLPPHGACLLGSINLAKLIDKPFTSEAGLDQARLESLTATAVRFLDDVIDVSNYPLPAQRKEAKAKRRIGLGVTGLADALILCAVRYGTPEAERLAEQWMAAIQKAAYLASAHLGQEKGAFPLYDAEHFLAAPNVQRLPEAVRSAIARNGIRNGLLTSIAPTGTISLLAGNVSSGVEPVFDFRYERRVLERDGSSRIETVEDYAHALHRETFGDGAPLTEAFVTAEQLPPSAHLRMQAALQRHVDSSISKTINCPSSLSFEAFKDVYLEAYALGLKGCTTYRPNAITGSVLRRTAFAEPGEAQAPGAAGLSAPAPPAQYRHPAEPSANVPPPVGRPGEIVRITEPLEREPVLQGYTYKLRWPGSDHAMYITINDIERDGRRRPFEVFINSKNLEHYAWTVALTRMISAIFRRGGDVSFVVEELKAVFDPQGGQWMGGRYVPSLLAAIGQVIETHMIRTGFLLPPREGQETIVPAQKALVAAQEAATAPPQFERSTGRICPRCNHRALVRREGCWVCSVCDYSKCD